MKKTAIRGNQPAIRFVKGSTSWHLNLGRLVEKTLRGTTAGFAPTQSVEECRLLPRGRLCCAKDSLRPLCEIVTPEDVDGEIRRSGHMEVVQVSL